MKRIKLFGIIGFLIFGTSLFGQSKKQLNHVPHIVFVMGDEEYRSEESMPMLARILKRELAAKISLCYAVDSLGFVNPNVKDHIQGLKALATADLMVLFTRFRALPEEELALIADYVESGKPVVGFRTATHAFKYEENSALYFYNDEWPTKVFGQKWITHHGHFSDGHDPLTQVSLVENHSSEILNGVLPFKAFSWLYHVDGGNYKLYGDSKPLLMGRSLRSKHEMENRLNEFPLENPVAWTKTYTGAQNKTARVFFTTLGHPYDFKEESMRKLAINGIYWALGREKEIPEQGTNVSIEGSYQPNNSGFGDKFKKNRHPETIE
ncbi:ThuA domain-containing protein [Allomuricauda sp. SCSIO 65647]|uniref:ThuA domain-containing protein n=1 Tax=Allomuricauda sp. SCSIO 65647 TaxID=2908843 RepID=UPI001F47DC55|nr:ThuA domain-containing protein [Muricauda sp. SCSIO 65647]UJH66288.1 ThuA domain-containing protein [Muricauda sp. SCSIO 65647]